MAITRISGFSSGLDIEQLVGNLMKAERAPLDKLHQSKQYLQWRKDAYREMNIALMDLRSSALNMKLQTSFMAKKATSSDPTVVTATATANTASGIYSVQVNGLATAASVTSGTLAAGTTSSTQLNQLGLGAATTLTVSGEKGTATINVNTTDTIASFVSSVNSKSSITGVQVNYDSNLNRLFFVSGTTGANSKIDLINPTADNLLGVLNITAGAPANGERITGNVAFTSEGQLVGGAYTSFTVTYGGTDYTYNISSTTTIGSLINEINSSSLGKLGVSAYLDTAGNVNFFKPDTTTAISFSNNALGLATTPTPTAVQYSQSSSTGTNASVLLNGSINASYASNTFSFNGMTMTALKTGTANINVNQDIDAVYNSIKGFVDKYNEVITKINSKITEEKYRSYLPLTEDQKTEMKEQDIKNWEDKAKSGILRSDSILYSAVNNLRNLLYDPVSGLGSGNIKQLTEIGITTGERHNLGQLFIDEAKLRDALATKPDQVIKLFTTDDLNTQTVSGDGLGVRVYNKVNQVIEQLTEKAGSTLSYLLFDNSTLGKSILQLDGKIRNFNDKLTIIENRYYRQFTAMEKAMAQYSAQSASFMSAFGIGN